MVKVSFLTDELISKNGGSFELIGAGPKTSHTSMEDVVR